MSQPHIETISNSVIAHFSTDVSANTKELKIMFSPNQEGTGDPNPNNVRAISGINDVLVYQRGKNLFDYANADILDRKRKDDDGNIVDDSNGSFNQSFIPVKSNTSYIVSGAGATSGICVYYYTKDYTWVSRSELLSGSTFSFTTPDKCHYVQIQLKRISNSDWPNMQIEYSGVSTGYESYNGQTIIVALPDTLYGGYLDLMSGELVQTWASVDMGDMVWKLRNNNTNRQSWKSTSVNVKPITKNSQPYNGISSIFKTISFSDTWYPYNLSSGGVEADNGGTTCITFESNAYSTGEEVA